MTTVLVTGANSGIGAATLDALLERGARVVATVRSSASARRVREQHPDAELTVALLDVTDAATAARVMARHRPDVVVNCAGDAVLGALMDIDDDTARSQFETLVLAPVRLARLLAAQHEPGEAPTGTVRVVNVSSMLASTALPFTGWYGAAKAALDATTDTLRRELAPRGIDVVRIECGAVDTPAWDDAGDAVRAGADATTAVGRRRWSLLTRFARPAFADPATVGAVVAAAALDPHPRAVTRVGFGSRFGIVSAFLPTRVEDHLVERLFGLREATT